MVFEGIEISYSVNPEQFPPFFPKKVIIFKLFLFAYSIALRIFKLFPEVEKQTNKSFFFDKASNCRAKIFS